MIQRAAPGAGLGVVVISAPQPDDAKERIDLARAILVDDFQVPRRLLIADQSAVIEQAFEDATRIAEQGIAQARFQALDDHWLPLAARAFRAPSRGGLRFRGIFPGGTAPGVF